MPQLVLLRQIIVNMNIVQIKKYSSENAAQHHSRNVESHSAKADFRLYVLRTPNPKEM